VKRREEKADGGLLDEKKFQRGAARGRELVGRKTTERRYRRKGVKIYDMGVGRVGRRGKEKENQKRVKLKGRGDRGCKA